MYTVPNIHGTWTILKVKYIQSISTYRAVNTLRLGYKSQSANVVEANNHRLF